MSHRLHWGRRKYKKEKSPKAKVKHYKKSQRVESTQRERTCFDFQPRWRRQKRREKWFTSADVFLARKSLKRQVGEFVRKKDMCEAVSCLEMNGDVCRFESLLLREKVSLKSFHLPLSS